MFCSASRPLLVIAVLACASFCFAQGPCPTATSTETSAIPSRSGDLICLVPQVYGPGGLVGTDHGGPLVSTANFSHAAHFTNSTLQSFSPLNTEIGSQISNLPITAPISGFLFSFNPSLGVVSRQTESFGPILTERADTIGKHKLFVGFSYQYFNFDKIDSVNLKNFGAVFQHESEPELCNPVPVVTCTPDGEPVFQKDVIGTQNRIDLRVNQFVGVATFGVTDRLDVSVAIPILNVREGMNSDANITSFEGPTDRPPCCVHAFDPANPQIPSHATFFSTSHEQFFDSKSTTGIGDITLRGKYEIVRREKWGLAVGTDVRLPTGDEQNFHGAGTWGVRPFGTFSYSGRIAPHASLGYQWNGDSILAGDVTTDTKGHLPNILTYSAGVDAGITHRISVTGDFIGQSLFDTKKITATTFTDFGGTTHSNIEATTATTNQAYISVGGKINPVGRLLVILNVLFQVNEAGLHSKPVPLVGLSYTF